MNGGEELRALIREVISEQLDAIRETDSTETVNLSTDEDLAAFVARLLDLDEAGREAVRSGRKRFRLAAPSPPAPSVSIAQSIPLERVDRAVDTSRTPPAPVRRVQRGAVTEAMVRDAARAGERLVLGRRAVLTPLARDRARAAGVEIEKEH